MADLIKDECSKDEKIDVIDPFSHLNVQIPTGYQILTNPLIEQSFTNDVHQNTTTTVKKKDDERRRKRKQRFSFSDEKVEQLRQNVEEHVEKLVVRLDPYRTTFNNKGWKCVFVVRKHSPSEITKDWFSFPSLLSNIHNVTDRNRRQLYTTNFATLKDHQAIQQGSKALTLEEDYQTNLDDIGNLAERVIFNVSETNHVWIHIKKEDEKFTSSSYLPPRSGFLWTNLLPENQKEFPQGWSDILQFAKRFTPTILLLDPPFPNQSAKRLRHQKATYTTLEDLYDLWRLRESVSALIELASFDRSVLIGCWVTNHPKIQDFVLNKLFPAWNLTHIGQLVWVKVTTNGQMICSLDNAQGRKPYEILLLAKRMPETEEKVEKRTKVFFSVPREHSQKPYILPLLLPWLSKSENDAQNVYELFARTCLAGPKMNSSEGQRGVWMSIGNEPFAYNQVGFGITQLSKER